MRARITLVTQSSNTALALRNEVRRLGFLDLRPGWYTAQLAAHTLLLAGVIGLFAAFPSPWFALPMAFAYYQLGLLYHDFGHHQAYAERAHNDWAAMFTGFLIGGSIARWRRDHDAHHAHTNDLTKDPDVEGPLAHTAEDAKSRRGFSRLLARTQHIWLLPISCLVLMPIIRSKDIAFVLTQRYRRRATERVLLLLHYAWYLSLVFGLLPLGQALLFVVVHQTLFGAMFSLAFIINHVGLPVRTGRASDAVAVQIECTRNVRESLVGDYLLGPLAPHIEHHTFPGMPRCNHRKVGAVLKEYASRKGLPYRECGFFGVYADLVRSLRALAVHANPRAVVHAALD